MQRFSWTIRDSFLNRNDDLERIEEWWAGPDRNALALYGRRRVGKSWLFRAFAHGKPAVILVTERLALRSQMDRFAAELEPHLGVRPDLPDLRTLIRTLYRMARDEKALAVIDEFPYLLPTASKRKQYELLTSVQAVMEEERDASQLKLVLCGSHISQMRSLLSESSPVRGRLTPLRVAPLTFDESRVFFPRANPREAVERYAVAGGTSLYLSEIGRDGNLEARVCQSVLNPRGPLFNDPREILEEELRVPGIYLSLLDALARGEAGFSKLASDLGKGRGDLTPYLDELRDMELVERIAPVAGSAKRDHRYRLADSFLRFWFRFVFPFQEELRAGLPAGDHFEGDVRPALADHVAPVFELLCQRWVRQNRGRMASKVGSWWGRSLDELRKSGERTSEEIDIVGVQRGRVTIVGECKWTRRRLGADVLDDLERYKLPALLQDGGKPAAGGPEVILFSREGFKKSLLEAARNRDDITLVDVGGLVQGLSLHNLD